MDHNTILRPQFRDRLHQEETLILFSYFVNLFRRVDLQNNLALEGLKNFVLGMRNSREVERVWETILKGSTYFYVFLRDR